MKFVIAKSFAILTTVVVAEKLAFLSTKKPKKCSELPTGTALDGKDYPLKKGRILVRLCICGELE